MDPRNFFVSQPEGDSGDDAQQLRNELLRAGSNILPEDLSPFYTGDHHLVSHGNYCFWMVLSLAQMTPSSSNNALTSSWTLANTAIPDAFQGAQLNTYLVSPVLNVGGPDWLSFGSGTVSHAIYCLWRPLMWFIQGYNFFSDYHPWGLVTSGQVVPEQVVLEQVIPEQDVMTWWHQNHPEYGTQIQAWRESVIKFCIENMFWPLTVFDVVRILMETNTPESHCACHTILFVLVSDTIMENSHQ